MRPCGKHHLRTTHIPNQFMLHSMDCAKYLLNHQISLCLTLIRERRLMDPELFEALRWIERILRVKAYGHVNIFTSESLKIVHWLSSLSGHVNQSELWTIGNGGWASTYSSLPSNHWAPPSELEKSAYLVLHPYSNCEPLRIFGHLSNIRHTYTNCSIRIVNRPNSLNHWQVESRTAPVGKLLKFYERLTTYQQKHRLLFGIIMV